MSELASQDLLHRLPRRDFLRYLLIGGTGLVAAACGERSRLGAPKISEEIVNAIQARERAKQRGEFKIPLPEWGRNSRITSQDLPSYPTGSLTFLMIEVPSNLQDNLLPALVEGKVIEISQTADGQYSLSLEDGGQVWKFSGAGKILVNLGEQISMGVPVVELRPNDRVFISAFQADHYGKRPCAEDCVKLNPSETFSFEGQRLYIPTLPRPKRP